MGSGTKEAEHRDAMKAATTAIHEEVHKIPVLSAPFKSSANPDSYANWLAAQLDVVEEIESEVKRRPALAMRLSDIINLDKAGLLKSDIEALREQGIVTEWKSPRAKGQLSDCSDAQVIGALYALEGGIMNGNNILLKVLSSRLEWASFLPNASSFLRVYPNGKDVFKAFVEFVNEMNRGCKETREDLCQGAERAFKMFTEFKSVNEEE